MNTKQIKIFSATHSKTLEEQMNEWLSKIPEKEIIDIKINYQGGYQPQRDEDEEADSWDVFLASIIYIAKTE